MNPPDPDEERGVHYSDGGVGKYDSVHYPSQERIQEIHREWEETE